MCPVVIISWLSFIFGFASSEIKQSLVAMGKMNRVARVECEVSVSLNDNPLHWYQRVQGGALYRVSYLPAGSGSQQTDQGFTATKDGHKSTLTILTAKETADYYCAYWETWVKKFGSGTRLIVTDRKPTFPSVTLYHSPKKRELLCVARGMFPDVLKMTWKRDGSKLQDVNQKIPTTIQEMKGTVSSLIISEKSGMEELRKYSCQVEHEGKPTPETFQVTSTDAGGIDNSGPSVSDPVTCGPKTSNYSSAVSDADPITKSELLTISLSYCMLILKSLTYFGTMSVVIYKRSRQTS